jgi:PAS domain S-box-containing protein
LTADKRHTTGERPGPTVESPALKRIRDSLAPLCQNNPVAMCITNRETQVSHANQAFLDALEVRPALAAIQGQTLHNLFSHHSHRVIHQIETLVSQGKSESLQNILHLGPDHNPTAMRIRVQILTAPENKQPEGALITLEKDADWYQAQYVEEKQALTARIRQLSADLMDRQALLKAMMDHSPFGIALLDNQRRIIQLNHTAEKILGMGCREARGILCNNLFHCFELEQRCPLLEDSHNINQQQTACAQPGKSHHTFLRSAVSSRERNEDIIIEAFLDITEMQGAQQAREEAYRAKDDFFAKMSHELRTPLNAIIGYSELIVDDAFPLNPEELKEYAGAIQRSGYDLLHLVDQVLNIAKLNDDKVENEPLDLHPEIILDEVASTIRPLASKNHNHFSTHYDCSIGTVYADPEHLRAILLNLLSNACKFTDHGKVTLSASREIDTGGEWVLFQISDTGIGLSDEQMSRIFDRFEQADNSITRNYGGSGLGLSIAKRLCEIMDGDIEVQSQVGQGSTFSVRLPGRRVAGGGH